MKALKRILSFLLLLCMVVTLMPVVQFAKAAETVYRYELDTDGIDPGATYLIVNTGSAGTGNALQFYYQSNSRRDLRNQTLTVKSEDDLRYIETGFTNETNCQFQFSAAGSGKITHGDYAVDLANSRYVNGDPGNTLTFTNLGNGQYRIYYTSRWFSYYLRYSNSDWARSSSTSSVYLYKLTGYVKSHDITFHGNGYTAGTLPENATNVESGSEYTVPYPKSDLIKEADGETWLFLCWNTLPDGTGTEYKPGDKIVVTENMVLYADWYLQNKHTISMITYMDGVKTDVDKFAGYDRQFFAVLEGGDGTYNPMEKTAEGTYSARVVDNGTYLIYAITADGQYSPVHGHKIMVYNQDGTTECMHYSINYELGGGTWNEGEAPTENKCHNGEEVIAHDKIPTREGYRFLGWKDQDGNMITPGHQVTASADKKIVLTAVWENLINVTVNVVIDHNADNGGQNNNQTKHELAFTLLREENGVNLPLEERILTTGYVYDAEKNITTYQVVFAGLNKGIYRATGAKGQYVSSVSTEGGENEDQVITINLKYSPDSYDLTFQVKVNAETEAEKKLMPKAVNVKVSYWGYDENRVLGWHIITQQAGTNAPTTVFLDENGVGTGFYPVWNNWDGTDNAYDYRVEVTSFVMPGSTIVPASGDLETYRPNGSGLYEATVSVEGAGRVPAYPDGSDTTLSGAYFSTGVQMGVPTVTVEINPMTVTFDAGDGKVNGQQTLVLENQYIYPALHDFVAVPNAQDRVFIGWTDAEGNLLTNQEGKLLPGNVTYIARYNENITISGTVAADAGYEQNGEKVMIPEYDRLKNVLVVLQKRLGDAYNDMDAVELSLVYEGDIQDAYSVALGSYEFKNLPNDGTEYRIHVLVPNYSDKYDNDQDEVFTEQEAVAQIDMLTSKGQVDVHLDFAPAGYEQQIVVDVSRISPDLRPTKVLVQILYRDLGDIHAYNVISQHTVEPYGLLLEIDEITAKATGSVFVWNTHTNGTPYEYQVKVYMVYGNNVENAYYEEGTLYTDASPYTVEYGPANNYLRQGVERDPRLTATLVPKKYPVYLDLNLGDDPYTPVMGLDNFMYDDGSGRDQYAFVHSWSYVDHFDAYAYREGYVFQGWETPGTDEVYIEDGGIHVGSTLTQSVTLKAKWQKLNGTDYTIRYLELNTDNVLQGATVVTGAVQGEKVVAAVEAAAIEGYVYVGAVINGTYINKADNPALTVTNNPADNLLVIYYLPDGSNGYTEQVESNLEINKTAVLENNGTYTITLDTFTKDSPITTLIQQNTPMDIVLVLDQSASIYSSGMLDNLKGSVNNFIDLVADHGRDNEVDHRIAIVGYASDEESGYTNLTYPIAGRDGYRWVNTGVYDSHGNFHIYPITGFNYTEYVGPVSADGTYYTNAHGDYLLLTYHQRYYHLITETVARQEIVKGTKVYGYVDNQFVELTRNSSGLWLYGDKKLYSASEFFTFHTDVWTHREGLEPREIHAYGVGADYRVVGDHEGIFTRTETRDANPEYSIYKDALTPVSLGANGSGGVTPGLQNATKNLGANGRTFVSYGMELANNIFEANPLDPAEGRIRIVVVFTDGKPGDDSTFDDDEANKALEQSYTAIHTHGADVYTIGLYSKSLADTDKDQNFFMNGLSSNYPDAKTLDDVWADVEYYVAPNGYVLNLSGPYFVEVDGEYYKLSHKTAYENKTYYNCWGYTDESGTWIVASKTAGHPVVTNGMVGDYVIYKRSGAGYKTAASDSYNAVVEDPNALKQYFSDVVREITTKITKEIILEDDTILRDIMNQGLVLTDGTIITAYTQEGNYDMATGKIIWAVDANGNPVLEKKVSLELGSGNTSAVDPDSGVAIYAYNLDAQNATDPTKDNYHPHTVDITGYNFSEWYISEKHTHGYKMVVTITRVEARDDVQWGRSTATNDDRSGLWLPADKNGNRQLLLAFDQPTTVFVERAYVLDYGKEFTLSGWYFDDEDGKYATPIHLDCNIADGMNWFDPANPNTSNAIGGAYGNTKYGNVEIRDGKVVYTPTAMKWDGYDQFYVFGNTWRKTVVAQSANQNGNLWNKVTVIPANNIYYEDSFVTTEDSTQNGIQGFTFTGAWSVIGTDDGNTETPEHVESAPYGDVHGWTDTLGDDIDYTDGTAHITGVNGEMAAKANFTFTGTGVEVYTHTNVKSGIVVAVLTRNIVTDDGREISQTYKSLAMDNLAVSNGEDGYYHIPTVTFKNLPYGTYTLQLIATAANANATGEKRYEYVIDGVRIHNPLGNAANYQSEVVQDAYDLETNAVFTEVRDILLSYGDFNTEIPDSTDGKMGAVFIDTIPAGLENGGDTAGDGVPTYEIGTYLQDLS